MKRKLLIVAFVLSIAVLSSCDLRSGRAKEEMEKFSGTPTPMITQAPEPTPVDPADVINVDTSVVGDTISVNGYELKKSIACAKFNPVTINGSKSVVTIKGVCQRITINGDGNQITVDAATQFIFNGTNNSVTFSKYPNGKRPIVTENQPGNTIEQATATGSPQTTPMSPDR